MARARAPEDKSSPLRSVIPEQEPRAVSIEVGDDDTRVKTTVAGHYIVNGAGEVVLCDRLGRPLGGGAGEYYRLAREGADVEDIARGLLLRLDADRNGGSGPIRYPD